MSEAGHLHLWMSHVNKFMLHYTRRPGLVFAPPLPAEAEEADKEVLGKVFCMVFHDKVSMDYALQFVVPEDLLRVKLMPQPKPPKVPRPHCLPARVLLAPVASVPKVVRRPPASQALQERQLLGFPGWVVSKSCEGLRVLTLQGLGCSRLLTTSQLIGAPAVGIYGRCVYP